MSIAFGPIVSRRFGRSLGVNHLPAKHCTYSCVYCQLGPTPRTSIERRAFYSTEEVANAVEQRAREQQFDVISFVPNGEPTLDVNLGAHIRAVKHLGKIVVITNGSLLFDPSVRRDLAEADIVSVEVDAIEEKTWRRIDRPNSGLSLEVVLEGMRTFAREFRASSGRRRCSSTDTSPRSRRSCASSRRNAHALRDLLVLAKCVRRVRPTAT